MMEEVTKHPNVSIQWVSGFIKEQLYYILLYSIVNQDVKKRKFRDNIIISLMRMFETMFKDIPENNMYNIKTSLMTIMYNDIIGINTIKQHISAVYKEFVPVEKIKHHINIIIDLFVNPERENWICVGNCGVITHTDKKGNTKTRAKYYNLFRNKQLMVEMKTNPNIQVEWVYDSEDFKKVYSQK